MNTLSYICIWLSDYTLLSPVRGILKNILELTLLCFAHALVFPGH